MRRFKTIISLLLAAILMTGMAMPAAASEDPMAVHNDGLYGEVPPAETQLPEETSEPGAPEETTAPEEPVPATEPHQALPEETAEEAAPEEAEASIRVTTLEGMPLYFQTDYPNTLFADSTLAKSGCSVTALAMVASYLTGYDYTPVDLARYFGGAAENNIARLEKGSETLGLPFYKAENWHKARQAIQEGKIAILLLGKRSFFTDSQHFIVVTGVNEEGRYLVNDSYEPNYDHWKLKQGFANGFEEQDLIYGYSGAWIYDKDAIPEDIEFYYEPDIDRSNPRYPDLQLTGEEMLLLARVIWVEARGESDEGQQAVAEVVLNRIASDRFPNTLRSVIYSEGQFRSVEFLKDADPYQAQYDAIERAIYGPYVLPEDVYHFATFKTNDKVWGKIGGHYFCYGAD